MYPTSIEEKGKGVEGRENNKASPGLEGNIHPGEDLDGYS